MEKLNNCLIFLKKKLYVYYDVDIFKLYMSMTQHTKAEGWRKKISLGNCKPKHVNNSIIIAQNKTIMTAIDKNNQQQLAIKRLK